ncbi:hypothetical protein [Microbulbifer sp. TRSA005]|uniref:hypothetical protein n=1 Tax=Microbulbifer sp. TRSA005 TaxID=3243383 RepID=UPI00403911BF
MNMHRVKSIVLVAFLLSLLACSDLSTSSPDEQLAQDIKANSYSFLTWYDGWGGHTVWGIGKVGACFTCGKVICGTIKVDFIVTYDSHTRSADSKYPKDKDYATTYNSMLLSHFNNQELECDFEFIPTNDSSASNK